MKAPQYNRKITSIILKIREHCAIMETRQYTSWDELSRDMAIGIELAQQYSETLLEMTEDRELLPLSDYIPMELR